MKIEQVSTTNTRLSYFESITDNPGKSLDIEEVLTLIKTGAGVKECIDTIRKEPDKGKANILKKQLPAIAPSGLFSPSRKLGNLKDYSGIVCLDFDNIADPEEKKLILENDSFCYAVFISPSGQGLKVWVKVKKDKYNHVGFYVTLSEYFKVKYDILADKSCKDITRLMFLSYDHTIVVNNKSQIWELFSIEGLRFEFARNRLEAKEAFQSGNRNNFVYLLACQCCKQRISQTFTEETIIVKYASGDFSKDEILLAIASAYKSQGNAPPYELTDLKPAGLNTLARVEEYINKYYDIRFNVVSTKIEWRKKVSNSIYQELNENSLYRELQHSHLNISLAKLASLMQSDFVKSYNPFSEYFNKLTHWDSANEPDYILKLCDYIPAVDQSRFRKHFLKMLVRCIACALEDRVFNKQVLVLVHDVQNSGKSTFCRWLCPPVLSNYITENINTDKDSLIALATNLFINMDELATLSRTEINSLKSFISKDKINVRLPFAKKATMMPRRANFIGSTNKDEFLSDETGSVRWLCFGLNGMINFAYKDEVNIDDVWRQAFTLYLQGFEYQLTPHEIEENEKANDTFQVLTTEMQLISKMLKPSNKDTGGIFFTATDIQLNLLGRFPNSKTNIHNIGRALRRLHFFKISLYSEEKGYTEKGYYAKLLINHNS